MQFFMLKFGFMVHIIIFNLYRHCSSMFSLDTPIQFQIIYAINQQVNEPCTTNAPCIAGNLKMPKLQLKCKSGNDQQQQYVYE